MARTQNRLKQFTGKQTFADNARLVFDLPRDYDYETIGIRVHGTTTLTVAGTAVRAEAPLQLLKFISLKANGTDLLHGLNGIMSHRANFNRRGQFPPLTPQAAATATAQSFSAVVFLDRAVIDGIRPKDGNFPSRGLSSFQLELQMGAATDCFTGAPTGTITSGTVDVFAIKTAEQVGQDGRISLPRVVAKNTGIDLAFTASNSNFQQRINTGNILRGLMLRGEGSTTAGEPSDAVINNVKVQVGNQVLLDMPYLDLRAMNIADYEVSTLPTGICIVDFMNMGGPAGKITDCVDLRGGEEIWAFLDVNGAANVKVNLATYEYMPYAPKYWGIAV